MFTGTLWRQYCFHAHYMRKPRYKEVKSTESWVTQLVSALSGVRCCSSDPEMASSLRSDGGVFERQPLKAFAESLARMSFKLGCLSWASWGCQLHLPTSSCPLQLLAAGVDFSVLMVTSQVTERRHSSSTKSTPPPPKESSECPFQQNETMNGLEIKSTLWLCWVFQMIVCSALGHRGSQSLEVLVR